MAGNMEAGVIMIWRLVNGQMQPRIDWWKLGVYSVITTLNLVAWAVVTWLVREVSR